MEDRELNQAWSKTDTVDRSVRTARTFVHHYNGTQYCSTETVLLIFPFLQINITSQMWPSGDKGRVYNAKTKLQRQAAKNNISPAVTRAKKIS